MASTIRAGYTSNRINFVAAYTDIGALQTRATALETLIGAGVATTATISAAAGAANVCNLTITMKDNAAATVAKPQLYIITLSDSGTTAALTATTASGTVTSVTNGYDVFDLTAKKQKIIMTNSSGVSTIAITDTSKTGFFPWVFIPGRPGVVGTQLVTGNYG